MKAILRSLPIAGTVAALITLVTPVSHASNYKPSNYERAMAEAGALADQERHGEALDRFVSAFEAMPVEIKISDVGEFVVHGGTQSAISHYVATGEFAALREGRRLAASFLEEIERAPAEASTASIERTQATLAQIERLLPKEPPPPPHPAPTVDPAQPLPHPCDCKSLDKLGLGLSFAGGLVSAGGLALIIAGGRQVPWYTERLEDFGWSPDATDYSYDDELDKARRARNINVGVGVGIAMVGVGMLSYGIIRLRKHHDRDRHGSRTQSTFAPMVTRRGGGLALHSKF